MSSSTSPPVGLDLSDLLSELTSPQVKLDADSSTSWKPEGALVGFGLLAPHRPGVDDRTFIVATADDDIVGVCIVYDSGSKAWVSQLATHRDHRGRGVAQRLLAETSSAARRRGLTECGLSTDARTGALDVYLRLGMTVRHTVDCWALDLTGGA